MNKPLSTAADVQEARDRIGLPHWYAMLYPLQDDGFGGIVCAPAESNEFVFSFVYEGTDQVHYYATGHA